MAKKWANIGKLHPVWCEWCGLKMSCNCHDGNNPDREGHIVVLCPRCQVTDFTNLIFGDKLLRDVLLSRIKQARRPSVPRATGHRPSLSIVARHEPIA